MKSLITAAVLLSSAPALAQVVDPRVTQDNIATTICLPGYAASVRPPFWVSQRLKLGKLREAGLAWMSAPQYELDHIVPLALGGSPADPGNLALQPWPEARRKDRLEIQAWRCVCAGIVKLEDAQADMAQWQEAYHRYARLVCRRERAP